MVAGRFWWVCVGRQTDTENKAGNVHVVVGEISVGGGVDRACDTLMAPLY